MKTTYYLRFNRRLYTSQNLIDMTGFSMMLGMLGQVEQGEDNFPFTDIMCIEP
jgi:hypothetical protein